MVYFQIREDLVGKGRIQEEKENGQFERAFHVILCIWTRKRCMCALVKPPLFWFFGVSIRVWHEQRSGLSSELLFIPKVLDGIEIGGLCVGQRRPSKRSSGKAVLRGCCGLVSGWHVKRGTGGSWSCGHNFGNVLLSEISLHAVEMRLAVNG